MITRAARMPTLRRFNVEVYNRIVSMMLQARDRAEQARSRYLAVIDQLAKDPQRRLKLMPVIGAWRGLEDVWAQAKPNLTTVQQVLQGRMAESEEKVQDVSADVAQAFFDLPKQADEMARRAAEFEEMVSELFYEFGVSAAASIPLIVEVAPALAERSPDKWTPDDLQLAEKTRRSIVMGRRAVGQIERFLAALEKPHRPWSAQLTDQARMFYDMLERGRSQEIMADLEEIEGMIRHALSVELELNQPMSPEMKEVLEAYIERAELLREVGERAIQVMTEIEREEVPAGQWPELQELEELEKTVPQQIAEAKERRDRGEIPPEALREIEEKLTTDLEEARRRVKEMRAR